MTCIILSRILTKAMSTASVSHTNCGRLPPYSGIGSRSSAARQPAAVRRYRDEIGSLDWAAPQDWMCEPFILAKTGLSVREHLRRTVADYLRLTELAPDLRVQLATRYPHRFTS
jgi:hypothetical protein